jgi:hypothetical protein
MVRITELRKPTALVFFRKPFRSYQAATLRAQKGMHGSNTSTSPLSIHSVHRNLSEERVITFTSGEHFQLLHIHVGREEYEEYNGRQQGSCLERCHVLHPWDFFP